jgi:hypothetical protein
VVGALLDRAGEIVGDAELAGADEEEFDGAMVDHHAR